MSTTYIWSVLQLDVSPEANGLSNVVYAVRWGLVGTDGTNSYSITGVVDIPYNPSAVWIDYNLLTEQEVLTWVTEILGSENITAYENEIADILSQIPQQATVQTLPWNT